MSILVTGGCSFVGSKFINSYFFKNPDAILVNIDCEENEKNVDEKVRYSMRYHFIKGNLSSYDLVFNLLNIFNIRNVVHFACQNKYDDNLLNHTHENVIGTHTLLEACRKYGKIKKFTHVLHKENNEEHEMFFSAINEAAELLSKSYCFSFNLPVSIIKECDIDNDL